MITTPIHDFLNFYEKSGAIRCHMPGNKGLVFPKDITEIEGADSLYESNGIIAESEKNAAKLFGAFETVYSCSGSTLAIQTMLAILRKSGIKRIAASRYSHKSLISSAVLLDLEIDWLYPDEYLSAKISPEEVKYSILSENKNKPQAVFITSIDYYGGICDVKAIAKVCDKYEIPLLVDNAHGAYLVFTDCHPIKNGAAICACSAHKTLPALTGAAYLNINDKRFCQMAKTQSALFGTSSPSYLILESLDLCNRHISEEKEKALYSFELIKNLKKELVKIGFSLHESDDLRITFNACEIGYSGFELAKVFKKNNIIAEMSNSNHVVLLFSTITQKKDVDAVLTAATKIKINSPKINAKCDFEFKNLRPARIISPREAYFSKNIKLPVDSATGKICAEIIAPCPPGIPVIMPGEMLKTEEIKALRKYGVNQISVCL